MNKKTRTRTRSNMSGACDDAARALSELLRRVAPPPEARRHFQTARVEFLKGLRAVLDARIAHVSKPKARGQSIPVE